MTPSQHAARLRNYAEQARRLANMQPEDREEMMQEASDLEAGAAALEAQEWRPIESAPKDGTIILLWQGKVIPFGAFVGWWSDSYSIHGLGGNWTDGFCQGGIEITHWRPLPSPPKEGE